MKFVWFSDLHFSNEGPVLGFDSANHARAVARHVSTHHTDAAFCLISGDLVDQGKESEYRALQRILGETGLPILPLTGNHDRRAALRQVFALPDSAMHDFVQYEHRLGNWTLLCLDTLVEGEGWGHLCAKRMNWLESRLEDTRDRPVILVMHHPPLALGLPVLDADNLRNGGDLLQLLSGYPNVRQILCGHVHRLVQGVVEGIPFATMRSVLFQAPPPHPAWDWGSFAPSSDALGLGIVHLSERSFVLQHEEFELTSSQGAKQPVS